MTATKRSPESVAALKKLRGITSKFREPNGRLQRPSRKEMERIEQVRREGEKALVMNQPHRRGDARTEPESAFGRFILRQPEEFQRQLKAAGEAYAKTVRSWRALRGVPNNSNASSSKSLDAPVPTDEQESDRAQKLFTKMIAADRVLQAVSHEGRLYVRQLVLDEYDLGMDQEGQAKLALWALAVHFGMLRGSRHPYSWVVSQFENGRG